MNMCLETMRLEGSKCNAEYHDPQKISDERENNISFVTLLRSGIQEHESVNKETKY